MSRVLIIGASGLTGSHLLNKLCSDETIDSIYSLTRKKSDNKHRKVSEIVIDFESIENVSLPYSFDSAFCCLGTTIKKSGSKKNQYRIDHDYVISFASLCKQYQVKHFGVVSSIGANARSNNFYLQTKGKMEDDVVTIGFESCHIVRPSLLLGERKEYRFGEKISKIIFPLFSPLLLGRLKKYRAVHANKVGSKLIQESKLQTKGVIISYF